MAWKRRSGFALAKLGLCPFAGVAMTAHALFPERARARSRRHERSSPKPISAGGSGGNDDCALGAGRSCINRRWATRSRLCLAPRAGVKPPAFRLVWQNAQTRWSQNNAVSGAAGGGLWRCRPNRPTSEYAAHGKVSTLARSAGPAGGGFGAALSSFGFERCSKNSAARICGFYVGSACRPRLFPTCPLELSRLATPPPASCAHLCPPHVPERVLRLLHVISTIWMGTADRRTSHRHWRCGCLFPALGRRRSCASAG